MQTFSSDAPTFPVDTGAGGILCSLTDIPRKATALGWPLLPCRMASWQESGTLRGSTDLAAPALRKEPCCVSEGGRELLPKAVLRAGGFCPGGPVPVVLADQAFVQWWWFSQENNGDTISSSFSSCIHVGMPPDRGPFLQSPGGQSGAPLISITPQLCWEQLRSAEVSLA